MTQKGAFSGKPNIAIIVPKGSSGAYIEELSIMKKQREFLLDKRTTLKRVYKDNTLQIYEIKNEKK